MKSNIDFIGVIIIVFAVGHSFNDHNVNINLETVFEFKPGDFKTDLKIIDSLQEFLKKIEEDIDKRKAITRIRSTSSFMKKLFDELGNLDNHEIDVIANTMAKELHREKMSEFLKLFKVPMIRKSVLRMLETLIDSPKKTWTSIASKFYSHFGPKFLNMRTGEKRLPDKFMSWVDRFLQNTKHTIPKKFHNIVKDLQTYSKRKHNDKIIKKVAKHTKGKECQRKAHFYLITLVKNALRSLTFDIYDNFDEMEKLDALEQQKVNLTKPIIAAVTSSNQSRFRGNTFIKENNTGLNKTTTINILPTTITSKPVEQNASKNSSTTVYNVKSASLSSGNVSILSLTNHKPIDRENLEPYRIVTTKETKIPPNSNTNTTDSISKISETKYPFNEKQNTTHEIPKNNSLIDKIGEKLTFKTQIPKKNITKDTILTDSFGNKISIANIIDQLKTNDEINVEGETTGLEKGKNGGVKEISKNVTVPTETILGSNVESTLGNNVQSTSGNNVVSTSGNKVERRDSFGKTTNDDNEVYEQVTDEYGNIGYLSTDSDALYRALVEQEKEDATASYIGSY